MTRLQIVILHLSTALLTLTGVVFAWMKYGMTTDDPFAVANHPLQPWMLTVHVVVAPVLVFALGWITSSHIIPKLWNAAGGKRSTGLATTWIAAPMVLTGYLLQVSSAETLRQVMTWSHWVAAGLFVIGYLAHLLVRKLQY
jgi:hypothetical protein